MNASIANLLREAVKTTGSYDPKDCLPLIEERLSPPGVEAAERFLNWCVDNKRTFGRNIHQVYQEYLNATR